MKNNMKTYHKLLALAAIAFGFTACQQEDTPSVQGDADAVKITASIGALQTRVSYDERNTTFDKGDQIRVKNTLRTSKNIATYILTDEKWNTADPFVWNGASKNEFEAWYPVTDGTSFDTFTLPTEQNTRPLLGAADWMIASSGEIDKPEDQTLELYFLHRLSKVTVTIDEWNDEFGGAAQEVSTPKIYSKGTALTATYDDSGVTITATDGEAGITPLVSGTSYTAIVAPAKYATTDKFMTFIVNGQEMTVLATSSRLTNEGLQAGLHYLFDLKVGKDYVTLNGVKVTPWAKKEIDGGVAEEVIPNTFDATAMTPEQLNAAVTEALEYGHTELAITLSADADATMFSAITAALAADGIEEGSIDLTISGTKTVPEYGFFDYDDYSDNDDKNIAGDKLKSLTLTDVETIGEYAFSACTYLESVNLPQVVTIGECAFNEWKKGTKLTSLNLPNATTIGDWAFAYSSLLTSVNLPKVTSIGMLAFGYCDLRTLNLPEVTTIDGEAFLNNYNLVSCSAPKATTIDYYPWGNCSRLETLELTAAGGFTLGNNLFANTPTGQINLVLNKDKESQVTQNADGTATWKTTNSNGGILEYTFKSITTQE